MANRIKLAFGVIAAIAVEILAKGHWAHAVWLPVALMFATDFEKVFGTQEVGQLLNNSRVRFLLGVGASLGVELLAKGPWAHAVWVPTISMLFTNMKDIFAPTTSTTTATSPAASSTSERLTETSSSTEALTPNEKPSSK